MYQRCYNFINYDLFLYLSVDNVNVQREEDRKSVIFKEMELVSVFFIKQFGKLVGFLVKFKL